MRRRESRRWIAIVAGVWIDNVDGAEPGDGAHQFLEQSSFSGWMFTRTPSPLPIGDWRRFERLGQLAAYPGFVFREDSSGSRERRGSHPR